MAVNVLPADPAALQGALAAHGYLADTALATTAGPVLQALEASTAHRRAVLLIDEVPRA